MTQKSHNTPDSLTSLYEVPEQAAFLHTQYFVEGAIVGACACPEIPLPDVWLPWVLKERGMLKNAAQADAISDVLFAHFKACLAKMHDNALSLPSYATYQHNEHYALSQWCEGLLMAHAANEKCWQGAWNKMQQQNPEAAPAMAKDLKHCLLMFSTFAQPTKAIAEAARKGDSALAEKLPLIAKSLSTTLSQYVDIAGELAGYLPNQFETFKQS